MKFTISVLLLAISISAYAQYTGGSNDGHSSSFKIGENSFPNIYTGGKNDGFSQGESNSQNVLNNIYKGGQEDGFARASLSNQNALTNIYNGGNEDGFHASMANNQNPLANIFAGGTNDGFAAARSDNLNSINSIYSGGVGDGFGMNTLNNQNSFTNIYSGGINDGYATIVVLDQNPFNPLPVTMLSFDAKWQRNDILLTWVVEDEIDVEHYALERSVDGNSFTTIKTVKAANTLGKNRYNYLDTGVAFPGVQEIYYRLKTVNKDRTFQYSAIVRISMDVTQPLLIVFPNPTGGQFTLRCTNTNSTNNYEYTLHTANGALIIRGKIKDNQTEFNVSAKPAGNYILSITKDGKRIQNFNIILIK